MNNLRSIKNKRVPNTAYLFKGKKDLDYLIKTLEETHPNLFFRLKKSQYKKAKAWIYKKISRKNLSVKEFKLIVAHFLHQIHDGNTSIIDFDKTKVLLIETQLIQKKLVVTKTFKPVKNICPGDIIVKVNNRNTYSYLKSLTKFKSYEVFENCLARLSNSFRYKCVHDLYNDKHIILLIKNKRRKFKKITLKWQKNTSHLLKKFYQPFKFRFLKDINSGLVKWDAFFDKRCYCFFKKFISTKLTKSKIPDFEIFLKKLFRILKEKNARYLIVDIRENNGGNSILGNNFITYLTNKSIKDYTGYFKLSPLLKNYYGKSMGLLFKKHPMGKILNTDLLCSPKLNKMVAKIKLKKIPAQLYKGKIILLTSYLTYSAAETFAALIKDNNLGILIGEPSGNGSNGPTDMLIFTLPNSKLNIQTSFAFRLRPNRKKRKNKLLNPDYFVFQTYKDYMRKKDTVLEHAKTMIKNETI